MSLHPTKTRIALLDEVRAGRVFRDAIGDSYISGDRKVNAAIREMQTAGWVELYVNKSGDYWRLLDAGRAVLAAQATRYRVEFTRVGRNHNVPPLETDPVDGPNHLAEVIYRYATPHLRSREVDVVVDLTKGTGYILCGWNNGGTFTVTRIGVE
ncbi:hypothetical protein [Micromonospora tarensis]|uniref:Uncharacterized protein n=1 Tax=Micromonospora tarensis TaxID=2806100 RepID=A0ABS1Y9T4_9ACTN|nr:hypothetical protein [Micromonospora tarensis]MBM0274107.1 hypothetical protein [Micromonospora tarensis]